MLFCMLNVMFVMLNVVQFFFYFKPKMSKLMRKYCIQIQKPLKFRKPKPKFFFLCVCLLSGGWETFTQVVKNSIYIYTHFYATFF